MKPKVADSSALQYPPEILFLAEIFGLDPEYIMKNPSSYIPRTGNAPEAAIGVHLDPDALSE